MIDRLRAIAVFATVAETGSFRAAARRLGLSPSVVSHHVGTLERDFGLALFYRTTRKLALTDTGERLFEHGRAMMAAGEAGIDALSDRSVNPSGLLRITAPAILQDGPIIQDISRFMTLYPRIEVALQFSDQRQGLIEGGHDIALRIGAPDDSTLKMRRLVGGTRVLCASPDYVATLPAIAVPEDLQGARLIGLTGTDDAIEVGQGAAARTVVMTRRLTVDTGHAARSFALNHQGIAVLPRFFVVANLADGTLVELLEGWELPRFDVYAVWPENAGARSLSRLLIGFLVAELAQNPPLARASPEGG